MTRGKPPRGFIRFINPHARNLTAPSAETDVQRDRQSHGRSRVHVRGQPAQHRRDTGECTRRGEDQTSIALEICIRRESSRGHEPDCADESEECCVEGARVETVGRVRDYYLGYVGYCVGRDGHQLGLEVAVVEAGCDGGGEQGEGAEGDADAKVDEVVSIEAPVGEGAFCVCPSVSGG